MHQGNGPADMSGAGCGSNGRPARAGDARDLSTSRWWTGRRQGLANVPRSTRFCFFSWYVCFWQELQDRGCKYRDLHVSPSRSGIAEWFCFCGGVEHRCTAPTIRERPVSRSPSPALIVGPSSLDSAASQRLLSRTPIHHNPVCSSYARPALFYPPPPTVTGIQSCDSSITSLPRRIM